MTNPPGIRLDLVAQDRLKPMQSAEKIRFILDEVEAGKVLVLESGLTPPEEAQLIQATMAEIDHEHFLGIEMQSYALDPPTRWERWFHGFTKGKRRTIVIGPATALKTIGKDTRTVETLILTPPAGA